LLATETRPVKVSADLLGIFSCALAILLGVWDVTLTAGVLRMSLQEKINFAISHSDKVGMLQGAEMVGLPVALLLGLLSRRTAVRQGCACYHSWSRREDNAPVSGTAVA
jgi:hypothetical protein